LNVRRRGPPGKRTIRSFLIPAQSMARTGACFAALSRVPAVISLQRPAPRGSRIRSRPCVARGQDESERQMKSAGRKAATVRAAGSVKRTARRPAKRVGAAAGTGDAAETSSLTERTYQILRREILSCVLEPGSEVSEADIAERLSVSKTPVREALGRLRADGFVVTFPRRGYQIVPLTIADMNELFDMRRIVEGGCGELAAERITDEELDALEKLADAGLSRDANAGLDSFIAANREFHLAIVRATGSKRLFEQTFKQLDELERFFYIGARYRDISSEVQADHHRIVESLRTRDPVATRKIMIEHNEATRRGLFDIIAKNSLQRSRLVVR
jgi:DNA-binding GntR family transcriptional regulator